MSSDETPSQEESLIEATPFTRAAVGSGEAKFRLRPIPVAIGSVFLVLALAALFMFTASAVRFSVSPLPTRLDVSGGFAYQLGERFLMLPGDYKLVAALDGYQVLEEPIEVTSEPDQEFAFELTKLPGILNITTIPEVPAEVFLDQEHVGVTPLVLDSVSAGLHDIHLAPERFQPMDTEIDVAGMRVSQTLTLELIPAWADVTIESQPEGATVSVDGNKLGTTPGKFEIMSGAHDIALTLPGYKSYRTSIDVVAQEPQTLQLARLIRSDGKLSIRSEPPGANVTISGRYRGQTPLSLALRPGSSYPILLSKVGFEPVERNVKIDPDEDISISATLSPVLGVIRLFVEPADAELIVDGNSYGESPTRLELTVREHRIEIKKEGFASFETKVTPQPGQDQQLLVNLQTEEEARVAAIAQSIETATLTLQLILPGDLKMGAGRREPGRRSNEIEREVVLTKPFYLGTHEVTNKQFKAFSPNHEPGVLGRSLLGEDDRPVVNVSWSDAALFCNWLSERAGLPAAYANDKGVLRAVRPMNTGYRLPTEAEWAYAARYASGGTPTRFPWGNAMPPKEVNANYADVSAANMVPYHIENYNDAYRGPSPVGIFPKNEFGIFDLAGNVSEWIHDIYSISMSRGVLTDPAGPEEGEYHVVRGSNYTHGRFSELRWTFRDYGAGPRADVGFRVARYLE